MMCVPLIHNYFTTDFFDLTNINEIVYYLAAAHTISSPTATLTVIRPYHSFVMNLFKQEPRPNSGNANAPVLNGNSDSSQ